MNLLPASVERFLLPHLGTCGKCRRPWKTGILGVVPHDTEYSNGSGCFPLCEGCWLSLTIAERLPHYERLIQRWSDMGCPKDEADTAAILQAVRNGL